MTRSRIGLRHSGLLALSLVTTSFWAWTPSAWAGTLYWTAHDSIQTANADGSDVTTLVAGLTDLNSGTAIAVNPVAGAIYWTTGASGNIERANLDGSGLNTLISGLGIPSGIALDATGKIYWTDENQGGVHVANADGSNVTTLVTLTASGGGTAGFAIDNAAGKMYWGTLGGILGQANLDGSGVSLNLSLGVGAVSALALDSAGRVYLASGNEIVRVNADGTGETTIVSLTNNDSVDGLAVDANTGKIYWTEEASGVIDRANLDGTGITTVISGLTDPTGITVVASAAVPEPSSWIMAFSGLAFAGGCVAMKRRPL